MIGIKTFNDRDCVVVNIDYACKLCNDLARLNMENGDDVFMVKDRNTIVPISTKYASADITSGIYAVMFVVDQMNYDIAYTRIGYDLPLSIRVEDVTAFINKLKTL